MREERGEEERKRVHPSSPERPGRWKKLLLLEKGELLSLEKERRRFDSQTQVLKSK
jgi:hypothetical protein